MGVFRPSQWEIDTLVHISRQVFHVKEQLLEQQGILNKIMATQTDAAVQLAGIKDDLVKVAAETQGLLDAVAALQAAAASAANVTPELQAAIDAVASQAKTVDDLVPDAPTV